MRRAFCLCVGLLLLSACGGDDGGEAATTEAPSATQPAGSPATSEPATSEPIPVTPETLAGIWQVEDPPTSGQLLHQIGADGSFRFDPYGLLDTDPWGIGTYELDGTEVIITVTNGACPDWAFNVDDIPENGRVLATHGAGCHDNAGEPWNLTRLSPISPSASAIVEPVSVLDPVELSTEIVEGIWLREGTGQLASFDDIGSYEIDGDTFVLSTDGSGSCAAGTTVTWTDAILDSVTFPKDDSLYIRRLRLTAPDNDCVGWTSGEQTWLRVSP